MTQEITVEGSEQIAKRLAELGGRIIRATFVVEMPNEGQLPLPVLNIPANSRTTGPAAQAESPEDRAAWVREFLVWADSHPPARGPVDDSRESIYRDIG